MARSESSLLGVGTDVLANFSSHALVDFEKVGTESVLDVLTALAQGTGDVLDPCNTVGFAEHLVEKLTRLFVVSVWVLVWVSAD